MQRGKNMHEVQTKYEYWRLFKRNVLDCCFKQEKQVFKRFLKERLFENKLTPLTELEMRD